MVKGILRIGVGPTMLYLTVGSNNPIKLQREDVEILESDTSKHVEEMDEEELVTTMDRLGIMSISLTDDEKQIVLLASKYVLMGYFLLTSDEQS
ncbi:MAG: hypothetical protein RTV72_16455 [Candidatus Thorarchaeota archaeon]